MVARFAPNYTASANAPNTYEDVVKTFGETGHLVVYSGASSQTIFGSDKANYDFRAWHDYRHMTEAAKFTPEGEHRVCEAQIRDVREAYGNTPKADRMVSLLREEIDGQVGYFQAHNDFPVNQRAFATAYLANPDAAIHGDFSKAIAAALGGDRSWGRLRDLGDTTPPSQQALILAHTLKAQEAEAKKDHGK
jgi:hypothetical protein